MKSMAALLTALILAMLAGTGMAASVCSTQGVPEHMQRYQSFTWDTDDGDWTACDQYAAQLLRTLENGAAKSYAQKGCILLYPSLRGNAEMGLAECVLNVLLVRNAPLQADALTISVNGYSYDFIVSPENSVIGSAKYQRFVLPLDGDGMQMLHDLSQYAFSVCIYADTTAVSTTIPIGEDLSGRAALEVQSRRAIANFCELYAELGLAPYALWDLNASRWTENRAAGSRRDNGIAVEGFELDDFACISSADTDEIARVQKLLYDASFYAGRIDGKFAAKTRGAIREAQRYYGLLPTGQPNSVLLNALAGGIPDATNAQAETIYAATDDMYAELGNAYAMDGFVQIQVNRLWTAARVLPGSAGADAGFANTILPANTSNLLLIADGWITNQSGAEMNLLLNGEITFTLPNGYSYTGVLQCEQMRKTAWGNRLLSGERARLIAYAEIPAEGVEKDVRNAALSLKISDAEHTIQLNYR